MSCCPKGVAQSGATLLTMAMTKARPSAPMFSGRLSALSNYHAARPFLVPELDAMVATGEHAFNAFKTLDLAARSAILAAGSPGAAKRLGRTAPLRDGWDTGVRVWAMTRVIVAKFADPDTAAALTSTGDQALVETNDWHDQFWGDCYCSRHKHVEGVNMLGELLMTQRAALTHAGVPIGQE